MQAIVFSGQGSQYVGMGEDVFRAHPAQCRQAREVLGYSLEDLCLHDDGRLAETRYTQPALYAVSALKYLSRPRSPAYLAGHSLGEFNALMAAGVFAFEVGLRLVKKRGELMARAEDGAMAAVIGLALQKLMDLLAAADLEHVEVANENSPTQFVISGPKPDIYKAVEVLRTSARACVPLKVSGAFHSSLMRSARLAFHRYVLDFTLSPPRIPVIANATARPYEPDYIYEILATQIDHTVRWSSSVEFMLERGVVDFVEISPKPVLAGLIRQTQQLFRAEHADVQSPQELARA